MSETISTINPGTAVAESTVATPGTFERKEQKYVVDGQTYTQLMNLIGQRVQPDRFGQSTVTSIYYDTPQYDLISRSLEKPLYKEKLRLRAYGPYDPQGPVFVELKKKFKGIVYKRRVQMSPRGACALMEGVPFARASTLWPLEPSRSSMHHSAQVDEQIGREIEACVQRHPNLAPAFAIIVERVAWTAVDDESLRITFDLHPRYRTGNLTFAAGPEGRLILPEDMRIMEIKCSGAYPLWLVRALSTVGAYPQPFSKYGTAFALAQQDLHGKTLARTCA